MCSVLFQNIEEKGLWGVGSWLRTVLNDELRHSFIHSFSISIYNINLKPIITEQVFVRQMGGFTSY
jgi:hypothetical protein